MPVKRSRDTRIGQRAHGIRGARRPILGVLVVVEKHAVTLLLPPFRTGQGGHPPLDCTRQRERRAAHFAEGPARLDPHIHMHPARAAGFGPAAKAHFLEQRLHFESDRAHVRPTHAGSRIEIDPQLVGMIEIAGAHRVRMQLDAAQIDDPRQPRRIIDHNFFRRAAGRKGQRHRSQPVRALGRRALLIKRLAFGAIDKALENDGTIPNPGSAPGATER